MPEWHSFCGRVWYLSWFPMPDGQILGPELDLREGLIGDRRQPPVHRRLMFAVFLLAGGWVLFRPPRRRR